MNDTVIPINGAWRVVLAGKLLPAHWPDRGSALAGLATEQRRAARREPLPMASALANAAAEAQAQGKPGTAAGLAAIAQAVGESELRREKARE